MALDKSNIKRGMKGSRGGRNRHEKTEVLKHDSKRRRRIQDKEECDSQLNDTCLGVIKTNQGNNNMFTENLIQQPQAETENGALAFDSTHSKVLDLFASGVTSTDKTQLIIDALTEDPILGLKACLYLRDVRNGQGNRDILRELFKLLDLYDQHKIMKTILPQLPEIGRWKDVVELIGLTKKLDKKIFKLIAEN